MMAVGVLARLLIVGGAVLVVLVIGIALLTGTWGLLAATVIGLVPAGIGHGFWRLQAMPPGTVALQGGVGGATDDTGFPGDEAAMPLVTARNDDQNDHRVRESTPALDGGVSFSGDAGSASPGDSGGTASTSSE